VFRIQVDHTTFSTHSQVFRGDSERCCDGSIIIGEALYASATVDVPSKERYKMDRAVSISCWCN
jgi:hypothetical protein